MKNKKTGLDIRPSTMKSYILGIQRGFYHEWGYKLNLLTGPIFACRKDGLTAVVDNKARNLQEAGLHTESHNVLSKEEVLTLFKSKSLSPDSPKGFQNRLIFAIGILTAMRPTAMALLSRHQFCKMTLGGEIVWKITGTVGNVNGGSKTSSGGWSSIGRKPVEVCVWDQDYANGNINFFKILDEYIALRDSVAGDLDRFFLAVQLTAVDKGKFFKRQPLGKNSFLSAVKSCCNEEGIQGSGTKSWMTTHGLRGTLATILFEAGHSDSSVSLRTGHRDPTSLKSYQHLRGGLGLRQQRDLLPDNGCLQSANKTPRLQPSVSVDTVIDDAAQPQLPPKAFHVDNTPSVPTSSSDVSNGPPAAVVQALLSNVHSMQNNQININIHCNSDKKFD